MIGPVGAHGDLRSQLAASEGRLLPPTQRRQRKYASNVGTTALLIHVERSFYSSFVTVLFLEFEVLFSHVATDARDVCLG